MAPDQSELLKDLTADEAQRILAFGSRLTVPSGASLFQLGDPAERLFLIERGRIRLTLPMQVRGREEDVVVEERTSGQTVGWSALIPPHKFTLAATAPLETEVIALPREELRKHFAAQPDRGVQNHFESSGCHWPSPATVPGDVVAGNAAHGGKAFRINHVESVP